MNFLGLGSKNKTFKPKRNVAEGTKQFQLMKYAAATLGSGNLRVAVMLPEGESEDEWLAMHTVDFFNQLNLIYGTITEFCTPQDCPVMNAGPKYEYHWADGVQIKKPVKVSAPEYVDYLMTWIQGQLEDESIFPTQPGSSFPKNFKATVSNIFKRLFRVYAHIYHSHIQRIAALGEEPHLNTSLRHFLLFSDEFGLVQKNELEPLKDIITTLLEKK
ncbi:Mob1/phocein [Blastocladiella britannica]|nr:Mob1/phocein [Blastocladiella britannica]